MLKTILCYKVKKGLRWLSATCAKYSTVIELADNLATLYGSGAVSVMRDIETISIRSQYR